MATTSQTTPENAPKNDKDNSNESGQGLDAKGFVDSPANEVGQGKNLQVFGITAEMLEAFGGCLCDVGRVEWNPKTDESSPISPLSYLCPLHSESKNLRDEKLCST